MFSYVLDQAVNVEPINRMEWYCIGVVVRVVVASHERDCLSFLSSKFIYFCVQYVNRYESHQDVYDHLFNAFERRAEIHFFSLQSQKLEMVCSKESDAIPYHKGKCT